MPVRRWPAETSNVAEPALWLDYETGQGVTDAGVAVSADPSPTRLAGWLNAALDLHGTKIMLSGAVQPAPEWLLPGRGQTQAELTPGWVLDPKGHWLGDYPQGRFVHAATGHKVNILLVEQWFPGHGDMAPGAARYCHQLLTKLVADTLKRPRWVLSRLPGSSFGEIWRRVAPWDETSAGQGSKKKPAHYEMEHVDDELGQLIQTNDPQHRLEIYTTKGRCGCGDCLPLHTAIAAPTVAYADGRFMYQGIIHDTIGAAPLRRLDADQAMELFDSSKGWAPARYEIEFTVPAIWRKPPGDSAAGEPTVHLGLFPVKLHGERGEWRWHYPNKPGSTHQGWADAAELRLARQWWPDDAVTIKGAIAYTEVNSFGGVGNFFGRLEKNVDGLMVPSKTAETGLVAASDQMKKVLRAAIRNMLLVGIGGLSRRWWARSVTVESPGQVPRMRQFVRNDNGTVTYEEPTEKTLHDRDTWHPEIAARIWGAARAEVLQARKLTRHGLDHTGALYLPAQELVAIQGDAIYSITPQLWTYPVEAGGADDGSNGRIRIKGVAEPDLAPKNLVTTMTGGLELLLPANRTQLNQLSAAAEDAGLTRWGWQ